jgi:hypothetical protein
MKKLLLLVASGMIVLPALAQQSTKSVVFKAPIEHKAKELLNPGQVPARTINRNAAAGAHKTTANVPTWFSYVDILYAQNISDGFYNVVYQDSNLTYTGNSGLTNVFMHGMGISFDPADSSFFADASAGMIQDYDYIPGFRVRNTNTYSVDSVAFSVRYFRNNTSVNDSLIIHVAKVSTTAANPPGLFELGFVAPNTESFITAWYDSSNNELVAPTTRFGYELTNAIHADTTTGGLLNLFAKGIALPAALQCGPGEKILLYVHFKSGTAYPLNTPTTSANFVHMYSYDLPGNNAAPIQNGGSFYAGLNAPSSIKYESLGNDYDWMGRSILVPSIAYTTEGSMTDFAFRVTCAACDPTSVKETVSPISAAKVYPNPANNQVTLTFNVAEATDVNVTVSNTMGQVLKSQNLGRVTSGKAVFSTSDLASGVYFYTVEANGQRSSGKLRINGVLTPLPDSAGPHTAKEKP